jgi:hypothetical protein
VTTTAPTLTVSPAGVRQWRVGTVLHRTDGPAIERANGHTEWCYNGVLHRPDGPAITKWHGGTEWWFNGHLHRGDGPAIESTRDTEEWWVHGKRHRIDGPAEQGTYVVPRWYLNHAAVPTDDVPLFACLPENIRRTIGAIYTAGDNMANLISAVTAAGVPDPPALLMTAST